VFHVETNKKELVFDILEFDGYNKQYVYSCSVQFYAECWSGENAPLTYDRYGNSSRCTEHVGKAYTNMVYRFEGDGQYS